MVFVNQQIIDASFYEGQNIYSTTFTMAGSGIMPVLEHLTSFFLIKILLFMRIMICFRANVY